MSGKKPKKDLFLSKSKGAGLLRTKKDQADPPAVADEEVEFKGADWAAVQKNAKALKIRLGEKKARAIAEGQAVEAKQGKTEVTVRLMDAKNPRAGLVIETSLLRNPNENMNSVLLKIVGMGFEDVTDAQAKDILDGADLELVNVSNGLTYLVGRYDKSLHVRATNLGDGADLCSDPAEVGGEAPAVPERKPVLAERDYEESHLVLIARGGKHFEAARPIKKGEGIGHQVGQEFHPGDALRAVELAEFKAFVDAEKGHLVLKAEDGSGAWYASAPIKKGDVVGLWTTKGELAAEDCLEFRPTPKTRRRTAKKSGGAEKADANGLDAEVRGHLKALELARKIDIRIRGLESDLDDARAEVKRIKDAIEESNQELRSTVRAADPGPLFDQRPKCARCGERTTALSQGPTKTPYTDRLLCPDCVRVLIEEQEAAARGEKQAQDAPEPSTTETTTKEPAAAPADTGATSCRFCDAGDIPAAKPGDDSGNLFHETADGWVPCVEKAEPSTTGTTPEEPDDMTDPGIDLDSLKFTRAKVREKFFALVERHGAAKVGWTLKPDYLSRGLGCTTKITVGDLKAIADTLDG